VHEVTPLYAGSFLNHDTKYSLKILV